MTTHHMFTAGVAPPHYGVPMRILHTSDWHLGRTLHGVDLTEHHSTYLDHLVDVVVSERPDAVLVAGDVYDRAIPALRAVELLSDALSRLAAHTQVILTPGNHDSATRLGFLSDALHERLVIQSQVSRSWRPITITGSGGDSALVYALPYLDPDHARPVMADALDDVHIHRSHEGVMTAALDLITRDRTTRPEHAASIVMAHAFVVGGEPSDSERDITVGGVQSVPSGVFAGHSYVALGHLHGPQRISMPDATVARYSGSPLAMSFSERNHVKSTVLVEIENGVTRTELLDAPVPRPLTDVTGTLEELLSPRFAEQRHHWVRAAVTDPLRPQQLNQRIREVFPHALVITHQPPATTRAANGPLDIAKVRSPHQVAHSFITDVTDHALTTAEDAVLATAIERAQATEGSR